MGLETGVTYIEDLDETWPLGSDDPDTLDNHHRNTKTAVKGSFPSLGAAAVTKTAAEINALITETGTETLTNKTLTSPIINEILDSNSNELVEFGTTASAVNHVDITNAATGGTVSIAATGDDTDVGLDIQPQAGGDITILSSTGDARVRATGAGGDCVIWSTSGNVAITSGGDTIINATGDAYGTVNSGTANSPSSGTVSYTGLPSWVKKITCMFDSVSTDGTSALLCYIGDSGGTEASGYLSGCFSSDGTTHTVLTGTSAYRISRQAITAASVHSGTFTLTLLDSATNTWTIQGTLYDSNAGIVSNFSGSKSLSGTLDRVLFSSVSTDNYDSGKINILYEG